MKILEVAVGGLCALAGGTSAAFATDESFFAFLSDPYSISAYAPCLTALVAGLGALAAFRQLTVNTATNDQVEAVAAGVTKTHRVAKEAGRAARAEGAATRVTARKESEKLQSGQAGIEAKIDELLALERAKAATEGREFGPDAAKTFEEQVRAILTSKDARKKPAQEALADNRSQDAADELIKVAAQEGAAAIDFAREAAETYREAASLYYNAQPQKALEAYREATRLDGSEFWSWIYLSRLENDQAGDVRAAWEATTNAARQAVSDRNKAQALEDQSELAVRLGDLENARNAATESLELRQQIVTHANVTPNDRRNFSVSLERLGDVEMLAGDLGAARIAFEESLETRRMLAAENPGSALAQRDVSVSLLKLGDVAVKAGGLDAARTAFEESHDILVKLAAANPGSAQAQRDVSVSLNWLGAVAVKARDLGAARTAFEDSLEIARRLAADNPGSAEAQRDVIVHLAKLAQMTGEVSYWKQALPIVEKLTAEGRLAPADAWMVEDIRKNASAEEN